MIGHQRISFDFGTYIGIFIVVIMNINGERFNIVDPFISLTRELNYNFISGKPIIYDDSIFEVFKYFIRKCNILQLVVC